MTYPWIQTAQRRQHATKWHTYADDVIGAWVADMDFEVAPQIKAALSEAITNSDLGYPSQELERQFLVAMSQWGEVRHGHRFPESELVSIGDVVQGMTWILSVLRRSTSKLVFFRPAYPPFYELQRELNFDLAPIDLHLEAGRYSFDSSQLETVLAKNEGGVLLLCNPHNPTGTVFTRPELIEISEAAIRNGLTIVSDEIHRDIVGKGYSHTPIASLGDKVGAATVTLFSASKTFNLAGLHAAAIHIPKGFDSTAMSFPRAFRSGASLLGLLGGSVAMSECAPWLSETLNTIDHNKSLITAALSDSKIKMTYPEGTYLCWLDFGGLPASVGESASKYVLDAAKVALSPGESFIEGGVAFGRLNLATDSETVIEIGRRLRELRF